MIKKIGIAVLVIGSMAGAVSMGYGIAVFVTAMFNQGHIFQWAKFLHETVN